MSDFVNGQLIDNNGTASLSFFQRIISTFTSPGKLMSDLAAKPRILFPAIMIAFAQLALYIIRLPLYKDFLRKSAIASSELTESLMGTEMTPEMIERSVSAGTIQSYFTTPLGSLFAWLFITVVFFAIFKITGSNGKFKQFLSITGYAYIISVLYIIITFIASFFTGSLHLDMPLTSLATLLSTDMKGNFLYGMLKGVDVFGIWYYTVIAIGLTAITDLKKTTVYSIVAGVFIVGLIIAGAGELAIGAYM